MNKFKRKSLKKAGWSVGSVRQFLGLSAVEEEFVELKVALAAGLQRRRESGKFTQAEVARRIGSSQSRVAKMEAGHVSVSADLLIRSLLALGASRGEVARIIRG
jgi:ParB-like chromosome segregation protein Spo0J